MGWGSKIKKAVKKAKKVNKAVTKAATMVNKTAGQMIKVAPYLPPPADTAAMKGGAALDNASDQVLYATSMVDMAINKTSSGDSGGSQPVVSNFVKSSPVKQKSFLDMLFDLF